MLGEVPSRPIGLLIGESPGYDEVAEGRPFVGPTGERLDAALTNVSLSRGRLAVVNAVACQPIPGASDDEKAKAVRMCQPLFWSQAGPLLKKKVPTLAMGKWATVASRAGATLDGRGFIRRGHLIVTWHPTFAFFHNPWEMGAFLVDLDRFARLIRREIAPGPTKLVTKPTAAHVAELLKDGLPVAVDIETTPENSAEGWTGKQPTRARLKTIGLGNERWGLSVWWSDADPSLRRAVKDYIRNPTVPMLMHNGVWFDQPVMERHGLQVGPYFDTRDGRRAVSATSQLALDYCVSVYDDAPPWKELGKYDSGTGVAMGRKRHELQLYNAEDCVRTARVAKGIQSEPEWGTPRVQRLYDTHARISRIAAKMHQRGLWVNAPARRFLITCLEQAIREKERAFCKLAKVDKCTPNVMRALLYERHAVSGLPSFKLPDPFSPLMYTNESLRDISVKEDCLLMLLASGDAPAEAVPIIDAFWEVQTAKKQLGTVRSEELNMAIGKDGRLRPGWNSCGTETMRWSCSEPNVMNIEQILRAMFGAPEGWVLVHADKSQLELRVMAAVSGDEVLQERLNSGDVYTEDAKDYFGLPKEFTKKDVKPEARKSCKITRLGSQYGAGLRAVWSQSLKQDRKMPLDRMKFLHDKFLSTHKDGLCAWWQDEMLRVQSCGYSEGRLLQGRRYYPAPPPITEVANYPIQRTAGEMMNLEIIELDDALQRYVPSAGIVVQLHDAFDVECREKDEPVVRRMYEDICQRDYTIEGRTRHFPVEIKSSRDWSDL